MTLHPNLARIAVEYVHIAQRCQRGELDAALAASLIRELVARDDHGVQWSIDPRHGGWVFRSRLGVLVPAVPPAHGQATLSPLDLAPHPSPASGPAPPVAPGSRRRSWLGRLGAGRRGRAR